MTMLGLPSTVGIALEEMLTAGPSLELVAVTPPSGFAFRRPADMVIAF